MFTKRKILKFSRFLKAVHTGDKIEFNTVDFVKSRLLPKPATNRQQSRLSPYMVNFVAGFGNKSVTTWIRQLVAVDIVANSVDFVARMLTVLSTLSPVWTGPKQHGHFCRLSTKSTVLNSTLLQYVYRALGIQISFDLLHARDWNNCSFVPVDVMAKNETSITFLLFDV